MRTVTILGSTGSIGQQALDVLSRWWEPVRIAYLATNSNVELLAEQVNRLQPLGIVVVDERAYMEFRRRFPFAGRVLCGVEGLQEAASDPCNDVVLVSLVGAVGILPTLAAIRAEIPVALASKEALVSAGHIVMQEARARGVPVLPVDSEHSGVLQCLLGEDHASIEQLVLTASGGPFRTLPKERFRDITVADALRHPNWRMGNKITVDSATLMNKGLEVIEARWLFDIAPDQIRVLIHPQSIVHALVYFRDGSVKAQLALPDMRIPIAYALSYPQRSPLAVERLDLAAVGQLEFEPPDEERFPCFHLALEALHRGGTMPAVLNAANEVAVAAFLNGALRFVDIPRLVEEALQHFTVIAEPTLEQVLEVDRQTRQFVHRQVQQCAFQ
ncbi:MAG: 1-deoxy-D-xylulose-5-phosphate reductoisomerase [Candidatus Kapabacteria bacterium]|nr:1-deoxy-D-xylulose-5-phosphate reductoisomerase [Candidatus Kapabacteria bacterium]MCS7169118.1 1-deoxy-D-xylulose-5-phosphate reductoisomerase [Candidatus Kapabacteria bacterium]MDW7997774.1 1-deoxy-D-xylulose-5-phosphate reductoisomerase [Bacteroidota bacterium]MDW8225340.1 1-deoxy-D-xylulose-5-phosphate reductoisomerase [Bacteroidota bacterium]